MIDRQAKHMARLVDDLLNVMRIASGKIQLKKDTVDVCRTVRDTVDDYRAMLESSDLKLVSDVPEAPIWVHADATRLAQVVGNLLHNAHKFTDPGGAVDVRVALEADGLGVSIFVRDTGIGIESNILPRVFDVFVQAEQGLDRGRGGLGLGLALVKGLIDLHGGLVSVTSDGPGKGSEFRIRLPVVKQVSEALSPDTPPIEGVARRRILIVEDNPDTAESTRLLLEKQHDVRVASTGLDGISTAREFAPQVILCDIGLPGGISGYDVARAIRKEPSLASTYVIALTGYGRDTDLADAKSAGFDFHITKPVDFTDLQRVLAQLP
jgi:CheY-like chemotaxis protein/two-component sensor histidine kinase